MYLVAYIAPFLIPQVVMLCLYMVALKIISRFPDHHIHNVFRRIWILEPGPIDTYYEPQSAMCGFVVPSSYIHWLAVYTTIMLYCVTAVFWYEFLLEQTDQHSCNPCEVDCFFTKTFWDLFKFVDPIDCNHVPSGVSTFTCYNYKFDINGAFWTAARVFGISVFIITALPGCFLFLKWYDVQRHRRLRYPIVLLCSIIVALLIIAVKNKPPFPYIYELLSISCGILLSLSVLFLDFKLIPAYYYLQTNTNIYTHNW